MGTLHNFETTIVAPATALNQSSALGILRLSGAMAFSIAQKITKKESFPPRTMKLCYLRDSRDRAIDQGLVVFFPAPHSATGQDVIEFHVHGNPLIMRKILDACCDFGATVAQPGEFLYRAFWGGKYDLPQIEGIANLISGRTEQAVLSGMAALSGFATQRLNQYAQQLSAFRCQLESAIDFSDQDDVQNHLLELCSEKLGIWIETLERDLIGMRSRSHALEGCDLILVGPPNAGKSSLLNKLADEDVSIVDDQPGTTRDLVKKQITIHGVPITLCDTAGLRETQCRIENRGIEKAQKAMDSVAVIVYMNPDGEAIDLSLIPQWGSLRAKKYLLLNKIDCTGSLSGERPLLHGFDGVFAISLKTGEGLDQWLKAFEKDVLGAQNEESAWLANARQSQYLETAMQLAKEALEAISHIEIAAELLKRAHEELGRITGEYRHEDLLGDIFSNFCIGK